MAHAPSADNIIDSLPLDMLACPACRGALRAQSNGLGCMACGRLYPVLDGIPVLIADRATSGSTQSTPQL